MPRLNMQAIGVIEIDTPPTADGRSQPQGCGLWQDLVRLGLDPTRDELAGELPSDANLPRWERDDAVALWTSAPPRLSADLPRLARELDSELNRLVASLRARS